MSSVEPFDGRSDCLLCGKALTATQQSKGNKFCGSACAYKMSLLVEQPLPSKATRYRRFGFARPYDPDLEAWLHGPCRRQKLSVYVAAGEPDEMSCPFCTRRLALSDSTDAYCPDCHVRVTLDKPFVA